FHIDLPDELARELRRCTDDAQVKQVGVEWAVSQASELKESGVPSIHFYAMSAVESVAAIARRIY
ncbi:MAG: methylenetetrahydrofolate reductase, partial [Paramuribaculum sp.]|nr:methylenetetrahydrofolate reductase [Paramuribaculum sp.]